jgi:hypothetical protein
MNIKEVWNVWRESTPADKDMQRAFERACTPRACHGVLIELESANQKIAELEERLWKTQQESEQAVTRAAEMIEKLEVVLNKLIDRAIPQEAWSVFPDGWLDEAVEALKEPNNETS